MNLLGMYILEYYGQLIILNHAENLFSVNLPLLLCFCSSYLFLHKYWAWGILPISPPSAVTPPLPKLTIRYLHSQTFCQVHSWPHG